MSRTITDGQGVQIAIPLDGSGVAQRLVSEVDPLPTSNSVAPYGFNKITNSTETVILNKGSLNKVNLIPKILNEHGDCAKEIQSTVTSTNIVGQIFKASKDNISQLMLTLESASGVALDNFESYANSAALQAVWIESGSNKATLEETIIKTGSKAMSLPCDTVNHEWIMTVAATNYTDYRGHFDAYFTKEYNKLKVSVFIGDGTNTKSLQLSQLKKNVWGHYEIDENAMTEDGGGTTDIISITKIGFRVDDKEGGKVCIIDNLIATPPPGEIEVKLWDMGASMPVSGVTSIDDGAQYTQIGKAAANNYVITLTGGKNVYHLHEFTAGVDKSIPTNELLTVDNYYLLELKYIDTDVDVYGKPTSYSIDCYENGYAFATTNESTAITQVNQYSNIMFGVFSLQDIYITDVKWKFDSTPNGSASLMIVVRDPNNGMTDFVVDHIHTPEETGHFDVSLAPMKLTDGGKLQFFYNDDYTDTVTTLTGSMTYLYQDSEANG
jgi:hypothetical protein